MILGRKKTRTVLVVEDDEATVRLLEIYLRGAGYEVLSNMDGKKGLETARARKPDLIVLDLMLPELHGVAVCHALKSDPKTRHIKVLVVSVKGFPADQKQVAEAGADQFLSKPIEKEEFLAAVARLLAL